MKTKRRTTSRVMTEGKWWTKRTRKMKPEYQRTTSPIERRRMMKSPATASTNEDRKGRRKRHHEVEKSKNNEGWGVAVPSSQANRTPQKA